MYIMEIRNKMCLPSLAHCLLDKTPGWPQLFVVLFVCSWWI